MSKEILAIVDAVSNEKGLDRERVFEALESALSIATKKKFNADVDIKTTINRKNGDFTINRRWLVVDTDGILENPSKEITLEAARFEVENIVPGEYIEEQLDEEQSVRKDGEFDRITAMTVKQVLQQLP